MWALMRGTRRLKGAHLPLGSLLALPPPTRSLALAPPTRSLALAPPTWSLAPLLSPPQSRTFASKQVKGQRPEPKARPKADKQEVEIWRGMTAADLAEAMNRDFEHLLEALLHLPLDLDALRPDSVLEELWLKEAVSRSGMKFRWAPRSETRERPDRDAHRRPPADPSLLVARPPVVTIMGHVDHGKTTLLDSLRRSQVAATEAGGITQHIGAFLVQLPSGERITFLDTPGHAAFSAMRARGAGATDIVILVVAADDGVMKQTVESIEHAKRAGVPMIVAVNKCDRPQADPDRVQRELLAHGVVCEDLGGDVQAVQVSALKGSNLGALAEATVALAEVLELKADPSGPVEALVIESRTDKGKGPVTTALVQRGTLRRGGVLVAGRCWAKVRFLLDENGGPLVEAGPGAAVQVVGWRELPSAGDTVLEVESEQRAREVVEWRAQQEERARQQEELSAVRRQQQQQREKQRQDRAPLAHLSWRQRKAALYRTNRTSYSRPSERTPSQGPRLPIVLKGDVDGSVEALLSILDGYDAEHECSLELLHFGVGDVSENDINMAAAFGGSVYGFNVAAGRGVLKMAAGLGVPVRLNAVIYQLVQELKEEVSSRLPPAVHHRVIGEASVLATFSVTVGKKKVLVAGCRVQKGQLDRKHPVKLLRGGETVWQGPVALRRVQEEVQTVAAGSECGVSAGAGVDFRTGDLLVCYQEENQNRTSSWDPGF